MIKRAFAATLAGLTLLVPPGASADTPDQSWHFSLTPYLWLPSIEGDLSFSLPSGSGNANTSVDAEDILEALDMAAMLSGTARRGRWLIGSDFMYVGVSGDNSGIKSVDLNPGSGPINVSTASVAGDVNVELDAWVWTMLGGYAVVQQPRANVNILGGFRYLRLEGKADWNLVADVTGTGPGGETATFARSGSAKDSEDFWTAIVGVQGRVALGEGNWFANGYVDVGGNSSVFTWQGVAGIGYAFEWGEVVLDYRYLSYSQDDGKLVENLNLGGGALGATFHF